MALRIIISAVTSGARAAVTALSTALGGITRVASAAGSAATRALSSIGAAASGALGRVGSLASGVVGMAALSTAALAAFAKESIQASAKSMAAFKGLESVANGVGVGIEAAFKSAKRVSADGILDDSAASKAVQNLLSAGYTLDQAEKVIERLKDSAAFGRQASLGWAEAVESATEGIRNNNSAVVDNAGVTKNISVMITEYAKKNNLLADSLTDAQRVQAVFNGIMRETENQVGNTAKALSGAAGTTSALNKAWTSLKVTVGEELTPSFNSWGKALAVVLDKLSGVVKIFGTFSKVGSGEGGFLAEVRGVIDDISESKGWDDYVARMKKRQEKGVAELRDGLKAGAAKLGFDLPLPPSTSSVGGTGIARPGPGGEVLRGPGGIAVKDNIDQARVAAKAAEKAKAEAVAAAKASLARRQVELAAEKAFIDDKAALQQRARDTQKASLDDQLARELITQADYSKRTQALDLAALQDGQGFREERIKKVQEFAKLAAAAEDTGQIESTKNELAHEVRMRADSAQQIKTQQLKAGKDLFQARADDLEREEQLRQISFDASIAGREKARAVSDERERALLESKKADHLISDEDYIAKTTALDVSKLAEDKKRIEERIAFEQSKRPAGAVNVATRDAAVAGLQAEAAMLEAKRVAVGVEGEAKLRAASIETATLRRDLDRQLAEAEGRSFDARAADIDAWLEAKRRELAAYPELLAKAEQIAKAQGAGLEREKVQETVSQIDGKAQRSENALDRENVRNPMSDIDLEERKIALRQAQAAALREQVEILKELDNGSIEASNAIDELQDRIAGLETSISPVAASLNEALFGAMKQGFQDLMSGAKSFGEVFKGVLSSVLSKLAELAMNQVFASLAGAMGGGGGGLGGIVSAGLNFFGFATGGHVKGPGTTTSDSIPAMLSNDEFVVKAASARSIGIPQLNFMNQHGMLPRGLASGGQAGSGGISGMFKSATENFGGGSPDVNVHANMTPQVAIYAGQLMDAISKEPGLQRSVLKIIGDNGKKVKSVLGA